MSGATPDGQRPRSLSKVGAPIFGDWRDTRAAIIKAYECIGETWAPNGDRREWEIVDAAIKADREARRVPCLTCKRVLALGEEVRCLDCKSVLCEVCAPGHFWPPSGRHSIATTSTASTATARGCTTALSPSRP